MMKEGLFTEHAGEDEEEEDRSASHVKVNGKDPGR